MTDGPLDTERKVTDVMIDLPIVDALARPSHDVVVPNDIVPEFLAARIEASIVELAVDQAVYGISGFTNTTDVLRTRCINDTVMTTRPRILI